MGSPNPNIPVLVDVQKEQKAQESITYIKTRSKDETTARRLICSLVEEAALNTASLSCFTSPADVAQRTQVERESRALKTEMKTEMKNDLLQEIRPFATPSGAPQRQQGSQKVHC